MQRHPRRELHQKIPIARDRSFFQFYYFRTGQQVSTGTVDFPTIRIEVSAWVRADRLCPSDLAVCVDESVQARPSLFDQWKKFVSLQDLVVYAPSHRVDVKAGTAGLAA